MTKIEKDLNFDTEPPVNPFELFDKWFKEANKVEDIFPNSFTLATADKTNQPQARTLLLRNIDKNGFVFYTNKNSRKGKTMKENPKASMLFYWKILGRQIEIEGNIEHITDKESDMYFSKRPRKSQIGAWASNQSDKLENRNIFEEKIKKYEQKFENKEIPRPPHWGGYRLKPRTIEFWQIEDFRLHRRLKYTKNKYNKWENNLLYP